MKKLSLFFLIIGFFIVVFYLFNSKNNSALSDDLNISLPTTSQKIKTTNQLTSNGSSQNHKQSSLNRLPTSYPDIKNFLPTKAPNSLRNRWEQKIINEDDRYITSQLFLDGKSLNEYFYRWEKLGSDISLIAGELPEVKEVAASFPSKNIQTQKINDLLSDKAELLSSKEIWILNSEGTLFPFLKIEVQLSEKPKRFNGHEYWIYDILKNSVTKVIQADRY